MKGGLPPLTPPGSPSKPSRGTWLAGTGRPFLAWRPLLFLAAVLVVVLLKPQRLATYSFWVCTSLHLEPLYLRAGVPRVPRHARASLPAAGTAAAARPPPPLPPLPVPPLFAGAAGGPALPSPPPGLPALDIVFVSGFPQQLQSSLRSLCHFMDTRGVATVHLVVPDRMKAFFLGSLLELQCSAEGAGGAPRLPLRFRVWGDSELVPAFVEGAPYSGTVRQMTLKLAAALVVATPFYLVMDSDVYARRPFGVADLLLRDGAGVVRARTGLDQPDFPQPAAWFAESARLLQTRIVADTDAFCKARGGGGGGGGSGGTWFAATGNGSAPRGGAFALLEGAGSGGSPVYGACRDGRGLATHVTPMLLSREIVTDVLFPRLESFAPPPSVRQRYGGGGGGGSWLDALLLFHQLRAAKCWRGALRMGRFYSWTEYSLYFIAAVDSGALDQYHAFHAGGITSFAHSVMLPAAYDAMDWEAVFDDAEDDAPFFLVHSWFGKPLEETNAHLAARIPLLAAEGLSELRAPSPLPYW